MPETLGHPRVHLRSTDSTNERARALAVAGAPHGTLVSAGEQSAGRGRQGRRWSAPAGSALLVSLVLRDSPRPLPPLLPLIAGVAVCDVAGERARIKWPNDVVFEHDETLAKLAGILVEGRPQDGWAVLGIGLNVAVAVADLPAELRATAATLGQPRSAIEPTLRELLSALERRMAEPQETLLETLRERDALRGRDVSWDAAGGRVVHGRGAGIDGEGRLVVALDGGGRATLSAGEVHLLRR
ncbi:MAG TPA: biotin--[acetyl-CoA-carboxylase] ligase [Solirubrobacteraceae bacterium]|nr:biotin--[acetyl-CoA-carboxylase] ligase [Solirubrobacteraceae bacterium]